MAIAIYLISGLSLILSGWAIAMNVRTLRSIKRDLATLRERRQLATAGRSPFTVVGGE